MQIAEELEKLKQLVDQGVISSEEFQAAKGRLLHQPGLLDSLLGPADGNPNSTQARLWAQILHLSALPPVAWFAPVVIWILLRERYPSLNVHAANVFNWLISAVIYSAVGASLFFLLIGIPIVAAVAVASFVFPLIGALKVADGTVWKYPLAIPFFADLSPR